GPPTAVATGTARWEAMDLGNTSPKTRTIMVMPMAAMVAPRAPHKSMATAVAMVDAAMLTMLLPTRMVVIMRWGYSSRSRTARARPGPGWLRCRRRNRVADRRVTSEPEKNAEARASPGSATKSSTLLGRPAEPSIRAAPPGSPLRTVLQAAMVPSALGQAAGL